MYGKSKKVEKDFDINEFDNMLDSSLKGLEDNEDIADPDLLKQLQEITAGSEPQKKPTQKKKPRQQALDMDIDIDAYTSLAQGDDDIEVDFDEKDLNDPNLLNELSLLSNEQVLSSSEEVTPPSEEPAEITELVNMGFSHSQAKKALSMFDNNLERAANYLFDTPMPADDNEEKVINKMEITQPPTVKHEESQPMDIDVQEEEEEESTDPEFYKNKAQEYQKMALKAKKEGDKKKAVSLLRHSKVFDQKYQELLDIQQPIVKEEEHNEAQVESPPEPQRTESKPEPSIEQTQNQELLGSVITLQKQYKEAALHYKGLGNIPVAKDMLRVSKDLLQAGIKIKNGEITHFTLPSPPDMLLGDGKIRQVVEASRLPTSLEQIESQLTYQMNICHNLSVQKRTTKRTNNSRMLNDNTQDAYLKAEEALSVDIMTLKQQQGNKIPKLHYEQVNYNYKNILDNIPDNMMEFKIIKALTLPTLDITSNQLDPFVTYDFGGWPPENSAQASMNKGETPVITASGSDPQFDYTVLIPIARTNRSFQRYLQRKKLTVEVFHNKYSYGLFRRPVSLGKAIIPMERLLTKSSISGVFDLLDGRKKTGGKIEIEINLREPLMGEDIAKRSERWLVLDHPESTVSQCLAMAGLTEGGSYVPAVTESPKLPEPIPVKQPQSTTIKKPVENEISASNNEELEAAEEEFNSVDNIVSNMVLEHEMSAVDAAIASGQSDKSKDDLIDRKQALEIKMNMLVIQVQTGLLDMETYLQNVQKRMEADLKLALIFKKHKRLDLAKLALVRKKIMQNEIDEARAAMAEQE